MELKVIGVEGEIVETKKLVEKTYRKVEAVEQTAVARGKNSLQMEEKSSKFETENLEGGEILMLMLMLKRFDDFARDLEHIATRGCQNSDAPQVSARRECGLNSSHSRDITPNCNCTALN